MQVLLALENKIKKPSSVLIDNDFPFSVHVIRTEYVQSVLLSPRKHSSEQQAFSSLNAISCSELW